MKYELMAQHAQLIELKYIIQLNRLYITYLTRFSSVDTNYTAKVDNFILVI